ncbi:MAG TPA: pyridoxamine 5'-phosphate oxidase family protein [Propionibacterium sp.]|nr:pyridoxamine 5'-phosphate oxidase family protein [Propionibacterium sp.]
MTDPQQVTYFSRLDQDECWALLGETEVGRIAWQGNAGIVVVPVNYQLSDRTIVFHTAPDSALAKLADGRDLSFQVDEIDRDSAIGWSVLVHGTAGPADASVANTSWLEGERTMGVAITASSIDGRVVSGTKKKG